MSSFVSNIASSSRRQLASVSSARPAALIISRSISSSRPTSQTDLTPSVSSDSALPDPTTPALSRVQLLSFPPLEPLPRPHGIHVASLHLASHHPYPLDLYTTFTLHSAHSLGIPTSNPASLPTVTSLYTVLKSPFVHKKSQENFERRTHRRVIKVWDTDRGVIDLWLRYLRKHGVGGVGVRAELFEWVEVGEVGREMKGLEERWGRGKEDEVKELAEGLKKGLEGEREGEGEGEGVEVQVGQGESAALAQEQSSEGEVKDGEVKDVKDTVDGA